MLRLTENKLDSNGYWNKPIPEWVYQPSVSDLDLFDQNGYDLTFLEQSFAFYNHVETKNHREHRATLKCNWFEQEEKIEGAVLNHASLFERKAYNGKALEQLKNWANEIPLIYKVIAMRPKWGLDFSMDYVDREGNAFEIVHWEYDGFDFDEIDKVKSVIEPILLSIDYDDAAKQLLNRKDEWHSLDFFAQSDWKCKFFGIPRERFKMVIWD